MPRVSLVAALIFGAALAAGYGSMSHRGSVAKGLLIGASIGLWMLGVVGLFSIGMALLLAGTLTMVGAARLVRIE